MKYVSTRGQSPEVDFVTACLAGLAPDGGLYVPTHWPQMAPAGPTESYVALASRILSTFCGTSLPAETIEMICARAYASFAHDAITPLSQWGPGRWMLELHHGPTLAFKDVAMQFIGHFYDHVLSERGQRMTVMCATSGDTGGAAAAAFAGRENVELVILHPHERVAPVQRLFMTTTGASNIHNFALQGDFDACQAIVKSLFLDRNFVEAVSLSGVNSINWARIAAQTVYYAYTQAQLGTGRPLTFVVPSGNMGDVLAGYVARRCGLIPPETRFVCAVNENKALADLLETGEVHRTDTVKTPSPAMDITVPSNAERLIYDVAQQDGDLVRAFYHSYQQSGEARLPESVVSGLRSSGLTGQMVTNGDTLEEMRLFHGVTQELICPHTGVGTHVARTLGVADPIVVLATAHSAKFPETVELATGEQVGLPKRCQSLLDLEESFEVMPATLDAVHRAVRERVVQAA